MINGLKICCDPISSKTSRPAADKTCSVWFDTACARYTPVSRHCLQPTIWVGERQATHRDKTALSAFACLCHWCRAHRNKNMSENARSALNAVLLCTGELRPGFSMILTTSRPKVSTNQRDGQTLTTLSRNVPKNKQRLDFNINIQTIFILRNAVVST